MSLKEDACPICGHYSFVNMKFCDECQKKFDKMVEQLRLAYIHQRGHPDNKTLWIHIEE